MAITIEIEKHPLRNFAPSRYCEWCVTVTTSDPGGFTSADGASVPLQWALDFPPDTDILDPEQAKKIKGAPKYKLDPASGEGTITRPGQQQFTICFVAACQDREGVEMSLENRIQYPPGASFPTGNDWQRVPYDGGPGGLGKIVGPAPVAMAAPGAGGEFASLASFEAQKLGALLGVPVGPTSASALRNASTRSARIYVSGFSERARQAPKRARRPR